ncbi:hypothetical protein DAEQUDRAFT_694978 [Daedalea quercina L-15889]|uniref:Secreted protein n=1 Tax=Daedalea quercina L-15889 TaxID=1314783 RepID=A0A165NCT6_9APHY|nr:hypothetical protein DAEQUDRAFT_694978 [Daedalea quercina L-15889]
MWRRRLASAALCFCQAPAQMIRLLAIAQLGRVRTRLWLGWGLTCSIGYKSRKQPYVAPGLWPPNHRVLPHK